MHEPDDLEFAVPVSMQPGLLVERRGLFATTAAALAAAWVPGSSPRWRLRQGPGDGFTVAEFVQQVAPLCKELLADTSARGQDRYLLALASFAVRLGTVPEADPMRTVGPGHQIGSNHGPEPFTVLHWRLAAGAVIEPHAHSYGNVVTLGLEGSVRLRNYEVVGQRDYEAREPFRAQCTVDQILRPGDVNLVSLERNYVHGFVAGPRGARGLDITTRIRPKCRSPVLVLGEVADADARVFTATWRLGD